MNNNGSVFLHVINDVHMAQILKNLGELTPKENLYLFALKTPLLTINVMRFSKHK